MFRMKVHFYPLRLISFFLAFAGAANIPLHAENADARARRIVSRMTLQEKITELHGIGDQVHRRYVPGIPRLGIPPLIVANGPCGVGPGDEPKQLPATALPAPIALAA